MCVFVCFPPFGSTLELFSIPPLIFCEWDRGFGDVFFYHEGLCLMVYPDDIGKVKGKAREK